MGEQSAEYVRMCYDAVAREHADHFSGELAAAGFVGVEVIERDPYPAVEYPSRRADVFASKPA